MEAYRKEGTVIKFRRRGRNTEAENIALEIAEKFELLSAACDNRALLNFPVDLLRDVVKLCNKLGEGIKDCGVHTDYIDYISKHKEIAGYFENSGRSVGSEEEKLIRKRNAFRIFKNMLSESRWL
jgi:hypothetical protein